MNDAELIADFVTEASEHLADIERQLLEIEAAGADADLDLVNTVFRAVHSTKGAAGFLDFKQINLLAHEAENVLNLVRNREFVLDREASDVLLRATDLLRTMLADVVNSNDVNIDEPIAELKKVLARAKGKVETVSPVATNVAESNPSASAPAAIAALPSMNARDSAATTTPAEPKKSTPYESPRIASSNESNRSEGGNVRISVQILDRLMNLAGELVLSRNQLLQAVESEPNLDRRWSTIAARIDQVTTELQESIMDSRLQPVGNVFNKFPRVVRDLAAKLKKQCNLVVEGQEVELDKTILEAIGDPLTHLIRNSLDHGVEVPSVRQERGKPVCGTIRLTAKHAAGKVLILVGDDGGGIDAAKLRQKAVVKGIISSEQAAALSDRDAVRLIFHPGFSTAEQVSDVSGRGVGMDVVKTNIEKIGGAVEVQTQVGAGTTIEITLPLTLAIMPSLIVHCCNRRIAVPQTMIKELVSVRSTSSTTRIERLNGREVLRLRGRLLPFVRLNQALGVEPEKSEIEEHSTKRSQPVIVLDVGQFRYALAVDALDDPEEIVVKPLGKRARASTCLAGATILGDGGIALILDPAGLMSHLRLTPPEESNAVDDAKHRLYGENHSILLFEQTPGEQFGVPMSSVARIERAMSVEVTGLGADEILLRGEKMLPLLRLDRHLNVAALPQQNAYYVLVFQVGEHEFGILTSKLNEVRNLTSDLDLTTVAETGVLGSTVVDGTPTRMIDVFALGRNCIHGRTAKRHHLGRENRPIRILLADDSDFFRKQIASFLDVAGFEVTESIDGEAAWELLQESSFDMLITDVEMPQMDGLELCRRVKADQRISELPVIAVTSHDISKLRQAGQDIGFDEIQSKNHRDQLSRAVERQAQRLSTRAGAKIHANKEAVCRK